MNDDFYEASFEVYYIFVRQKLAILGFSPKIFFILTSVTSETFWGQTMRFSDLTEVSNFSWRCQLSYEILFVELEWKLKHPETAISQRALLDHPRLLNWPKSPHRLGLNDLLLLLVHPNLFTFQTGDGFDKPPSNAQCFIFCLCTRQLIMIIFFFRHNVFTTNTN